MAHEILIVDDEPDIRLLIEGILSDEGYETRGAGDQRCHDPFHRRWRVTWERETILHLPHHLHAGRSDGDETSRSADILSNAAKRLDDLRLSFGSGANGPFAQHGAVPLEHDLVRQQAARNGDHFAGRRVSQQTPGEVLGERRGFLDGFEADTHHD